MRYYLYLLSFNPAAYPIYYYFNIVYNIKFSIRDNAL